MTRVTNKIVTLARPQGSVALRSPDEADADAMLVYLRTMFSESYRNMNFPRDQFARGTVDEQIHRGAVLPLTALAVSARLGN